jgi:hypothetical protein
MWPRLLKIQYTELKLSCGNDPVVKNNIYSNLDLWPNYPKINRVLPIPQGNHVAKIGKDLIYRTNVIVRKSLWTPARPSAIPNHIIRTVSRRAYKKLKPIYRFHKLVFDRGDNRISSSNKPIFWQGYSRNVWYVYLIRYLHF